MFVYLFIYILSFFFFFFQSPPWRQAAGLDPPRVGCRRPAHRGSRQPDRSLFLPPPLSSSQIVQPPTPPRSAPVSVSLSFQAWNHLIIAYSFFGRLLNAQPLKGWRKQFTPGYHTQAHSRTRTRTCTRPPDCSRLCTSRREGRWGGGGGFITAGIHLQFTEIHHRIQIEEIFLRRGKEEKKRSKY